MGGTSAVHTKVHPNGRDYKNVYLMEMCMKRTGAQGESRVRLFKSLS